MWRRHGGTGPPSRTHVWLWRAQPDNILAVHLMEKVPQTTSGQHHPVLEQDHRADRWHHNNLWVGPTRADGPRKVPWLWSDLDPVPVLCHRLPRRLYNGAKDSERPHPAHPAGHHLHRGLLQRLRVEKWQDSALRDKGPLCPLCWAAATQHGLAVRPAGYHQEPERLLHYHRSED